MLKCKLIQCPVHKSVQSWDAKGECRTINVHQIHSRSEGCGNLHALQGAEQGPKAGRESPPVCETGCRSPSKKLVEKKIHVPPQKAEFCVQRDKRYIRLEAEIYEPAATIIEQTKVIKHLNIVIMDFYNNQLSKQKDMQESKTISKLTTKQTFSNKQNQFTAGTNTQMEARKKKVYVYIV